MPVATLEAPLVYDRVQREARFENLSGLIAKKAMGREIAALPQDDYQFYAVRNPRGTEKEIFPLKSLSGAQLARQISQAPVALQESLAALADRVREVLTHSDDPAALEHHAILFWPELNALHDFLGLDLRVDELIAALDVMRSQFRLKPVSLDSLQALEQVIREAAHTSLFTAPLVDAWVDRLADAGVDTHYPLSFEPGHAD